MTTYPPAGKKLFTKNFIFLFILAYLMYFSFDCFIPVLPFYIFTLGGNEFTVGMLMSVFTILSIVLRPLLGRWSDQAGRRKLLNAGILLYLLSGIGLLFFRTLPVLFLIRSLQGIGWGAFLLAFNTISIDLAPPRRKAEAVGVLGITSPLSLATAPLLAETLRPVVPGFVPLFLLSLTAALVSFLLSSTLKEPPPEADREIGAMLLSRKVLLPSAMIFFITFGFGGILTYAPLLGEARGISQVGAFFTTFALITIVTRPLSGRLADRWGRDRVFLPGLAVLAGSLAMIALSYKIEHLLLGGILFGAGFGLTHPAIMALAADRLASGERGVGMATFTTAFDLGIFAAAIFLGFLLTRFDFLHLYLVCAAMALLPLPIYLLRKQLLRRRSF